MRKTFHKDTIAAHVDAVWQALTEVHRYADVFDDILRVEPFTETPFTDDTGWREFRRGGDGELAVIDAWLLAVDPGRRVRIQQFEQHCPSFDEEPDYIVGSDDPYEQPDWHTVEEITLSPAGPGTLVEVTKTLRYRDVWLRLRNRQFTRWFRDLGPCECDAITGLRRACAPH